MDTARRMQAVSDSALAIINHRQIMIQRGEIMHPPDYNTELYAAPIGRHFGPDYTAADGYKLWRSCQWRNAATMAEAAFDHADSALGASHIRAARQIIDMTHPSSATMGDAIQAATEARAQLQNARSLHDLMADNGIATQRQNVAVRDIYRATMTSLEPAIDAARKEQATDPANMITPYGKALDYWHRLCMLDYYTARCNRQYHHVCSMIVAVNARTTRRAAAAIQTMNDALPAATPPGQNLPRINSHARQCIGLLETISTTVDRMHCTGSHDLQPLREDYESLRIIIHLLPQLRAECAKLQRAIARESRPLPHELTARVARIADARHRDSPGQYWVSLAMAESHSARRDNAACRAWLRRALTC